MVYEGGQEQRWLRDIDVRPAKLRRPNHLRDAHRRANSARSRRRSAWVSTPSCPTMTTRSLMLSSPTSAYLLRHGMAVYASSRSSLSPSRRSAHTFLNSLQSAVNAIFAPVYHRRASIYVESTNGTQVLVFAASLTVKDSATGEYAYIEQVGRTVSMTWPTSTWRYLYLVSTNGVASVEISSTAPATGTAGLLFKTGDETRRYLCAVRCDPAETSSVQHRSTVGTRGSTTTRTRRGVGTVAWVPLDMSIFVPPHARRNIRARGLRTRLVGLALLSAPSGVGTITVQVDANSTGSDPTLRWQRWWFAPRRLRTMFCPEAGRSSRATATLAEHAVETALTHAERGR